jgi:hypothetical protein
LVEALASRSPALDLVGSQVPDSVLRQLRDLGALDSGEVVRYVFAPAAATVRDAFVLTDRRAIRLTHGVPRAHAVTDILGVSMVQGISRNAVVLFLRTDDATANTADTLYTGLGDEERASLHEKLIVFRFAK